MVLTNREISRKLRERARSLACAGDNLYRIRAFRAAALAVLALDEEVSDIVAGRGPRGLEAVPGIGKSLAETIASLENETGA